MLYRLIGVSPSRLCPDYPHCLRRRSQFAFGLVLPGGKSIAFQAIALLSHKSYAFAGALNCYPLGLWLDRSIIMPIYRLCRKGATLFYNMGSSRSDTRLQERRNEKAVLLSSWRTCYVARIYRNVSVLPLCCMPLSCILSFFKVHRLLSAYPKVFNGKYLWME